MDRQKIGVLSEEVINLLSLPYASNSGIYISPGNIAHMKNKHPQDFEKYGADIETIIAAPDYVGLNPKDDSIEYVKNYLVDTEYVKVAVRVSRGGVLFVRSMYVLGTQRTLNFITAGKLKPLHPPLTEEPQDNKI